MSDNVLNCTLVLPENFNAEQRAIADAAMEAISNLDVEVDDRIAVLITLAMALLVSTTPRIEPDQVISDRAADIFVASLAFALQTRSLASSTMGKAS